MPPGTIDAYQDHGDPFPTPFSSDDIDTARDILSKLGAVGVDYDDVVDTLEREGVEKFVGSWLEVLDEVRDAETEG